MFELNIRCFNLIFVFFLTILTLILPVKISIFEFFPAFFIIWSLFILLNAYNFKISKQLTQYNLKVRYQLFFILMSFIFVVACVYFYTGLNVFVDIFDMPKEGAYYHYQSYFINNVLKKTTLERAPFSLMLAYVKTVFIVQMFFMLAAPKIKTVTLFLLAIIPYLLFGFFRGTSLEVFEIVLLLFMAFFLGIKKTNLKKVFVFIFIFSSLGLLVYNFNIKIRMGHVANSYCVIEDFCFNSGSWLAKLDQGFAVLVNRLGHYFSFGFYYISKMYHFSNGKILFLPNSVSNLCNQIQCGYSWVPDIAKILEKAGLFLTLVFFLLLDWVVKIKIVTKEKECSFLIFAFVLFYNYLMISILFSNLFSSISSNVVILIILIFAILLKKIAVVRGIRE